MEISIITVYSIDTLDIKWTWIAAYVVASEFFIKSVFHYYDRLNILVIT